MGDVGGTFVTLIDYGFFNAFFQTIGRQSARRLCCPLLVRVSRRRWPICPLLRGGGLFCCCAFFSPVALIS